MPTASARRAHALDGLPVVLSRPDLARHGVRSWHVRTQTEAQRWQLLGRAVVRHNGPLTPDDRCAVALLNCGPRSVLTAFTALERAGLVGWSRPAVHVLAPAGVPHPKGLGFPVVLHRTATAPIPQYAGRRLHRPPAAAVLAASTTASPRHACGLLAAVVQQRLVRASDLATALGAAPRVRHRRAMVLAVHDIAMGAHALGEIDLRRLCRVHGLPLPHHQAVRVERSGRRRYLDAEWVSRSGRRVAAEIDGAVHLAPLTWFADQLRHNEIVIAHPTLLRWPSVIVRHEPAVVADQLRRALRARGW